jgi:hypothetical protein
VEDFQEYLATEEGKADLSQVEDDAACKKAAEAGDKLEEERPYLLGQA